MKHFFSLCALAFGLVATAQAQTSAMKLMGSVQSDTKEPLTGAAITIIHLPSGARHAAASDGTGHFAVDNLLAGGPYLMRIGEGGYRSQTVENIFLENGKTATFTVVLSKLGTGNGKTRAAREPSAPVLASTTAVAANPTLAASPFNQPKEAATSPTPMARTAPAAAPASTSPAPVAPANVPADAPRPARTGRYPSYTAASTRLSDFIVPGHFDAKSGNYLYETGEPTTLKLTDGGTIANVGTHSTESNLYRFITDTRMQVDTVDLTHGWYNFDRVFFDAGKATLTTESLKQLRNVAALLKAYPRSRIKIGGYTDSTGTYKINKELSEDRAHAALDGLVGMGISPTRIEARGYGPRFSIAPNSTEEGRATNRRLSVKVLQK